MTLKSFTNNNLFLFICANALYSASTGLINILSPILLKQATYEQFIYIFQNIIFLTTLFTAGFIPTLLRFYKYDKETYKFYYQFSTLIIYIVLFIFSFWQQNPILLLLKISTYSTQENLIIFSSIIASLLFIFNRGYATAENKYKPMILNITIIAIVRTFALILIYYYNISNIYLILIAVCILPFIGELFFFIKKLTLTHICSFANYKQFILFSLKISIAGIIYLITNRLFLIATKSINDTLAASVSFSIGLVGILHIFNTSFVSYFIGKLDAREPSLITQYLQKIKRATPFFITFLVTICTLTFLFVYIYYPNNTINTAIISTITIFQSAIITYIGLITLLTKTYNMLNVQICINFICLIIVFILTNYFINLFPNIISLYCTINIIIILGEYSLAKFVLKQHKKSYNNV
mgnify:CR=1 FL=1